MPRPPFFLQLTCFPLAWLTFLLLLSYFTAWAQTHTPTPVYNMGFASQINKALIIHGGKAQLNPDAFNSQTFALDLTVPRWDTSSPPWRYLTAPVSLQAAKNLDKTSMVLSSDETRVLVFDRDSPYLSTYDIASDTWLDRISLPDPPIFSYRMNYTVALDPLTNVAYLGRGAKYGTTMMVYDTTNLHYWDQPMPDNTTLSSDVQGYSFVYCASRKSILLFGGKSTTYQGDYNPYLFEFQIVAYRWIRLVSFAPTLLCFTSEKRTSRPAASSALLMHVVSILFVCCHRIQRETRRLEFFRTAWSLHMTGSRWWSLEDRSHTIRNWVIYTSSTCPP